ncbi:MAG: nucleotidyltransferase family protein [Frankiales bacterium]|nr:nucleotidyltransferase family protein [Frankiales bacterium]
MTGAVPLTPVTATLQEAFDAAAASGDRLAVLGHPDGTVAGVVTDADVRRAVLHGAALDSPVLEIVSPNPLLVSVDDSDEDVRDLLTSRGVPAAAAIDAAGRLSGVRRLRELDPAAALPPVAVLMVGGRGERLRPLTDKVPKPLLRIGGATIVERLIDSMRQAGVEEFYLTLNYLAEQFEDELGDGADRGVRISYVREQEAMGTAGSLSLLPPISAPLLVSNGDLVTTIDFAAMLDFHRYHHAAITVAGVEYAATVPYGVLRTADHHLLHIDEKPTTRQLVSGGIYVLSPEVLRYVPRGTAFTMPDLIAAALRDGLAVTVFPVLERWSDIGSKEELERVLYESAVEKESS